MTHLASLTIGICGLLLACSGAAADWMIFAVDGKGNFGHGVGSTKEAAVEFALSFCGKKDCKFVEPFADSGCMSLAQSFERRGEPGYWLAIGTAPTEQKAREFAMDFCSQTTSPQDCKVYYSFCLPH
jgi:hypothetical protein